MRNSNRNVDNDGTFTSNQDMSLYYKRIRCKALCHKYNTLSPNMVGARLEILKRILGKTKSIFLIEQPFMCDYGFNIKIGENFYANHNLIILDEAEVTFGDNVLVGPNCSFYTPSHPFDFKLRKKGLESSKPISVGDNVWFCGNVTVLPGVSIGENSVIGAGSIVCRDIPSNVLAFGNPCKVIKELNS